MESTPDMTESEQNEILKAIARNSRNDASRIAAIRQLRAIGAGEVVADDGFAGLYEVSNPGRKKAS